MFSLFTKENEKTNDDDHLSLISVAALLIHSAKIDENYTEKESLIIKKALIEMGADENKIDQFEIKYLIDCVNKYFVKQINEKDVVQTYSGIRPLIEDFKEASKVTRDYIFDLNTKNKLPILSIYGGKLTTYRKLSEKALNELSKYLPINPKKSWTDKKKLI